MANPTAPRADTRDIAALLSATDAQGNLDPLAFQAQRLIYRYQRVDGIDAPALVADLQTSPLLTQFEPARVFATIDARLDNTAERNRFAQALDAANLTDTALERAGEIASQVLGDTWDQVTSGAQWADRFLTKKLSWSYEWAQDTAQDPQASLATRAAAQAAQNVIGQAQFAYGAGSGGVVHALDMLQGTVDLGKLGYRFSTDENFRDLVIASAKLYAAQTAEEPSKPLRDLKHAASEALDQWQAQYRQAKAEGRDQQFLGSTAGAVGVELVATVVPASKLRAFGKVTSGLLHGGSEAVEAATELSAQANQALRHADQVKAASAATPDGLSVGLKDLPRGLPLPDVGGPVVREALEDLSKAVLRGERAGHVAQEVLQAQVRMFRDDGHLQDLLLAAQRTGNVEGILRSGELAPNELGRLAKLDPQIFDGKVSFQQAISYSVQGVPLAQLSTRQLGDIGEALHTFDLLKQGHTDIVSIKNASGHGIDIVSRNPQGELVFAEIKTSAQGKIIMPNTDPAEFVGTRLERAIERRSYWSEHNTMPDLNKLAQSIHDEIFDPLTEKIRPINAKWINFTLEGDPNSSQLRIGKTEQDWAKPEPKITLQPSQPEHPLHGEFSMILQHVPQTWRGEQKDNIAAGLLYEIKRDGLIDRLTRVVEAPPQADGTSRLFASGIRTANGMVFNVSVSMQEAAQQPMETTFAQLETLTQERALVAQKANERGPDDPSRGGPQMV